MAAITSSQEITLAVKRFLSYIRMNWDTDEAFEIAYDSVYDLIEKEEFLNLCQTAVKQNFNDTSKRH